MQLPVTFSLRPSRRLALLLILAHGAAAAALVACAPDVWIELPLLLALLTSLWWQLACLFGARRIVRLTLHKDGAVECLRQDGQVATCTVHPQTTVTPVLAVLLLRGVAEPRVRALALLPDALEDEDFRRLRLWLRWMALRGARGGSSELS